MNFAEMDLNWTGLFINVIALVIGFFIYIGIYHSPLAEKLEDYKYFVLLVVLIVTCIIGGVMRMFLAV